MTRGNQREKDRTRNLNQKKQNPKKKLGEELTVEQRKLKDANAMREKQKQANGKTQSQPKQ